MSEVVKEKLPSRIGNNFSATTLVLFVHGLGGENYSWFTLTKLLETESNFNVAFDFKYYDYKTGFISSIFLKHIDIINISESLESRINESYRNYNQIILVGHSMGGLISKLAVIETCLKKKKNRIDTLVFYDTPHLGSKKASLLKRIVRSVQVKELVRDKNFVIKYIQKLWLFLDLDKLKLRYLIAEDHFVVDEESSSGNLGNIQVLRCKGTDHLNIYKPTSNEDTSFTALYNILKDINDEFEPSSTDFPTDADADEEWYTKSK